ncbi:MAG: hypothetical protein WBL91_15670, partial [Pseudolabrys sp.]
MFGHAFAKCIDKMRRIVSPDFWEGNGTIRSAAKNRIFLEAGKSRLFDHLVSGGEQLRMEFE